MTGAKDFWRGRAELVQTFGTVVVENGEIVEPRGWESRWMQKVAALPGYAPQHGVYLNRLILEKAQALFARWQEIGGYEIKHAGFFAPRSKRGYPALLSLHTYGIAFDLNPDDNPMQAPGEAVKTDIPAAWIAAAEELGWVWGGRFHRPDAMHFQPAAGV